MQPHPRGFILIIASMMLTTLLVIGSYIITIANTESTIAHSQMTATKTYYAAESGIYEMLWKLENDQTLRGAFIAGELSQATVINRSSVFGNTAAGYMVNVSSTAPAEAVIIATSTHDLFSNQSQRVVKVSIVRATGTSTEWELSGYAGGRGSNQNGNLTLDGSGLVATFNGGQIHANQNLKLQKGEVVFNDAIVSASNNIIVNSGATLTLNSSTQSSPTSSIDMPQIDFDSSDPSSWRNRATLVLDADDFEDLPDGTTLNGIIYVTDDAEWVNKNLTVQGTLVFENDFEVRLTTSGKTLTINFDPVYGGGILTKEDFELTLRNGGIANIQGLIYASQGLAIELQSPGASIFTLEGSLVGLDTILERKSGTITINYVANYVNPVLDPELNTTSPLIQIDHWEERY